MDDQDEVDLEEILAEIRDHVPTWTRFTAPDFLEQEFHGPPPWPYPPPINPLFVKGTTLRHPDRFWVDICEEGRCLVGNVYRLRMRNQGDMSSEPDNYFGDYDEEELLRWKGRA